MFEFTPIEKIKKAVIDLDKEKPFWAYLLLKLDIREDTTNLLPEYGSFGVNARGTLYYKPEAVMKHTFEEIKFMLAHEVSHLAYMHLTRLNNRNQFLFNVATDIIINDLLIRNGMHCHEDWIKPHNSQIKIGDVEVIDIDKKSAEQIYDEINSSKKNQELFNKFNQKSRFDTHMFSENMSEEEKQAVEQKWNKSVIEAATYSKQRGTNPLGMDRVIGDILNPKLSWKHLLQRYIIKHIPYDYSWAKLSRKGLAAGVYLPSTIKEKIEIIVSWDTSGSINNEDLLFFKSECFYIAKSHPNITMKLIICDAEIHDVYEINSNTISDIENVKIKGNGGTSHKPIWNYIQKNNQVKVAVIFTDGYSDIEPDDKPHCDTLFILPKYAKSELPFGEIIQISE